jgi:hypothetical protein
MKLSIRSGLVVLWLLAAVLLTVGLYATRAAAARTAPVSASPAPAHSSASAAAGVQDPADRRHSAGRATGGRSRRSTRPIQPAGPPATGVGSAVPISGSGRCCRGDGGGGAGAVGAPHWGDRHAVPPAAPLRVRHARAAGHRLAAQREPVADSVACRHLGHGPAGRLRCHDPRDGAGARVLRPVNTVIVSLLGFTEAGARFLFGNLVVNQVPVGTGEPGMGLFEPTAGGRVDGCVLRLQRAADHHLLLVADDDAVPLRRDAGGGEGLRMDHDAHHAHVRRRDAVGGGQHLRRPDGGAAADQAVRGADDHVGAHGRDDRRLSPRWPAA